MAVSSGGDFLRHRGFLGTVNYSEEDDLLVGHVLVDPDVVGYHGRSLDEVRAAFIEAVDDYIDHLEESGRRRAAP